MHHLIALLKRFSWKWTEDVSKNISYLEKIGIWVSITGQR